MDVMQSYESRLLETDIRSRFVDNGNGLTMHVLEAGNADGSAPCLLLLHGFPELAYSWRKVMLPLAAAGYHVIAPDQRGYGRTTGWSAAYDGDLRPFGVLNLVRDALGLVSACGYAGVAAVIGHDFGSPVAACCALIRPDVFPAVVMMSAPFGGPPARAIGTHPPSPQAGRSIDDALGALKPPRKHYQWYYSTREAAGNMQDCPQGPHAFLRAYYHFKSADWRANQPYRLSAFTAAELAKLPTYYVMARDLGMAETVAPEMPSSEAIAACTWLPDRELAVYSAEYERTGFQGGLQWYRCGTSGLNASDLSLFAGKHIDVPATFIAGNSDWGTYQRPGDLESMERAACSRFLGTHLIEGAGHWVQQEQPQAVVQHLKAFLAQLKP